MSDEFENKNLSNEEFVKVAYRVILDREAESNGLKFWLDKLNNGTSRKEVLAGFVESIEFANLCAKYEIERGGLLVTNIMDCLNFATSNNEIVYLNGLSPSASSHTALVNAIKQLQANRREISVLMIDLETGKGVTFNPDKRIYGASTIKAPFVFSLCEYNEQACRVNEQPIKLIFKYSDNENYIRLARETRYTYLQKYYDEIGVAFRGELLRGSYFAFSTSRELVKLWARSYEYISTNSYGATVASWSENPQYSAMKAVHPEKKIQSKVGWWPNYEPVALNDAGIVYSSNGTYFFSVLTTSNKPTFEELYPIMRALDQVHDDIDR